MGAEGLGRKLLLTPSADPHRSPWKAGRGYCDSISQNADPASTFSTLSAKRGCLGRGQALGALREPVPQNGRVHFHIIDTIHPELFTN